MLQPETARKSNTRGYQTVKGKCKNLTNRKQDHSASPKPSLPTTVSPGYPNTPEKQDSDLKSYLMVLVEDFKKGINNSLKEIQENTAKQVEALKEEAQKSLKKLQKNTAKQVEDLKEETQKSLKELQENKTKQVMELNKTIQDLKMEGETMKKTQRETTLVWIIIFSIMYFKKYKKIKMD